MPTNIPWDTQLELSGAIEFISNRNISTDINLLQANGLLKNANFMYYSDQKNLKIISIKLIF